MLTKQMKRVVRGVGNLYRREILRDQPLLEAKRWFRDRGDQTLRLNYPLGKDSVVVDLGGYIGDWAAAIHGRYGSTVHIFEPIPSLHARCVERFSGNPKIHSHKFGLGGRDGTFAITDNGDASSFVSLEKSNRHIICEVRAAAKALAELDLEHIDLLKINIEGGEYDVLPDLIKGGWLQRIQFLQIQFHTVGECETAREAIRTKLAKTHDEQWCYYFVWEGWERKRIISSSCQKI